MGTNLVETAACKSESEEKEGKENISTDFFPPFVQSWHHILIKLNNTRNTCDRVRRIPQTIVKIPKQQSRHYFIK